MTNASTNDTTNVKITITDTSPKNSPILLSKNKKIENAKIVVIIAEISGMHVIQYLRQDSVLTKVWRYSLVLVKNLVRQQ